MKASSPAPGLRGDSEVLWKELAAPLRRFLRGRVKNSADAEDLLQEVFVRIHKGLPRLQDTSKIQGWVYRIARNVLVDHYRTRPQYLPFDLEIEGDVLDGESVVDLRPSLRRFIRELPVDYREPLVRHEFQGQSIQDVASELGLTLSAAKSRVQRARGMLRTLLDRCCRFEFDRRGRVIEATPRTDGTPGCRCSRRKS